MRQLADFFSRNSLSLKSDTIINAVGLLFWLITAGLLVSTTASLNEIEPFDFFESMPAEPYGLLLIGSCLTCCLYLLIGLATFRSTLFAYTLLHALSSSCCAILLLLYPQTGSLFDFAPFFAMFQFYRTWAIAGICSTIFQQNNGKMPKMYFRLHGVLLFIAIAAYLSEFVRHLLSDHLYLILTTITLIIALINIGVSSKFRVGNFYRLTIFIALTHLATIYSLDMIADHARTTSKISSIVSSSALIIWIDVIFIVFISWTMRETQTMAFTSKKIKTAQQQQKLQDITGIITSSRHELRSPLSDIVSLTELIADSPLDNRQRSFLMEIQHSARKGLNNINRLFSFHSRSHENTAVEMLPFNIEEILHDSIQYYAIYLDEHNGEIVTDISSLTSTEFVSQPEKLRQLLINILETLLVQCSIRQLLIRLTTNNRKELVIEFNTSADQTGENKLEPELNYFETAEQLALQLHGSIEINPNQKELIALLPLQTIQPQSSADTNHWLRGKRALVIDDNHVCCGVMLAYLEKMGVIAYTDTNAINAVARLHHQSKLNQPINIVLVDYLMPDSDGLDVIKHMFADDEIEPKPHCILMSNTPPNYSRETLRQMGIDYVLEKPVLSNTLHQALSQVTHTSDLNPVKQIKALIIEDNEISSKIICSQLEQAGVDCTVCANASDATVYLDEHEVSVILMDYNLPDMHCHELVPLLQSSISRSEINTTLVAISADDSPQIAHDCEKLGTHAFFAKPLNSQKISQILQLHNRSE